MIQTKKLNLIKEATSVYPGQPVNTAMWLFLKDLFNEEAPLSSLLSKYLYGGYFSDVLSCSSILNCGEILIC